MTDSKKITRQYEDPGSRTKLTRGLELLGGTMLALSAFLFVLWLLNLGFPKATDIGAMMRRSEFGQRSRGPARVRIEDAEGQPFVAVLSDVFRDVKDKPAYAVSWSSASDGKPLEERHAVQSFDHAGAIIEFGSGTNLSLGENSLIIVRALRDRKIGRRRQASLTIVDGSLRGRVGAESDSLLDLEVSTPGGVVRTNATDPVATDFNVTARPDGSSTLTVYEGRAEVQWGTTSTIVPANHAVVFSDSASPGIPRPLPATPLIDHPRGDAIYPYRDAPPRIEFAWRAPDQTSRFRYQIARDRDFHDIVHEELLSRRSLTHGHLESGVYYWRISGLQESVEGSASPPRRLEVLLDREAPPLRVDFPDRIEDRRVVLRGLTEPGGRVLIGEEQVVTNDAGEFEYAMDLRNGYNVVVLQAVDSAGNTTFKSGLINAEF